MLTAIQVRRHLLGCFEILLFMRSGIDHFDYTRKAALRSFLFPLATLPFVLYIMAFNGEQTAALTFYLLHAVRIIITLALFFGIIYMLTKQLGRDDHFYRFVNAYNWLSLPFIFFFVPIALMLASGDYSADDLNNAAVFVTLLGYVYTGFIATHCFRLPWELGAVIAIFGMFIDQTSFGMGDYLQTSILGF